MTTIIITGSVGSGKTYLAKALAKKLNFKYIDANKIGKELSKKYDKERKATIVPIQKLNTELIKLIKKHKNTIIDSHMSHFLPKKYVETCIITTSKIETLTKRLKKREYSTKKIQENLQVEIFNIIEEEAEQNNHNILKVDTLKDKINKIIKQLKLNDLK